MSGRQFQWNDQVDLNLFESHSGYICVQNQTSFEHLREGPDAVKILNLLHKKAGKMPCCDVSLNLKNGWLDELVNEGKKVTGSKWLTLWLCLCCIRFFCITLCLFCWTWFFGVLGLRGAVLRVVRICAVVTTKAFTLQVREKERKKEKVKGRNINYSLFQQRTRRVLKYFFPLYIETVVVSQTKKLLKVFTRL